MNNQELSQVMDGTVENNNEEVVVEAGNLHNVKEEHGEDIGTEVAEKKWPGWPGESVFRILVPSQKVGGLIGRKGELIKKMCEESRARIKILHGPPGLPERAVIISAKEEPCSPLPPAVDGLLRVHKRITEGLDAEPAHALPIAGSMSTTRLLVAAAQAGSLIGKQGATIRSIQDASSSVVRVVETLPLVALPDDKVVEIQGDANMMHKALELIATHLRKFLVDRSVIPLFENFVTIPLYMHMEPNLLPPHSWGQPQGLPSNAAGPGYVNPQFMPPGSHDKYYPKSDFPALDKQPQHGISTYGQNSAHMGVHSSVNQPASSIVSQFTHQMQIPLSYADAVIGAAGANISYIRRASGSTITIQESRGIPGEMTVEINGSATQVQTAQQLIQNFMAEAASIPAPAQNSMAPADQGYSSYPSYGSVNPEHAAISGGYHSMYRTDYGC